MIAIIDTATEAVVAIVHSTEGMDMEGRETAELPEDFDPVAVSHVRLSGEWVRNEDVAWTRLRAERDARLLACDWTQLGDVPDATREAWQPYRQALRDMTDTADPFAPEWPSPPES